MTATTTAPAAADQALLPEAATAPLERGTRFRRRAAGITAIAAAAVTLAGFLTCPWEDSPLETDYLSTLAHNEFMATLSMVLLHYGYLLFVPVFFVLARLARRRSPKLAATGLALGVLGSGLSGFLVTDAYDLALAQNLPLEKAASISDAVSPVAGMAMGLPTVYGTILGFVVVLAAMWRARYVSVIPAVVMLAGWVVGYGAHTLVQAGSGAALVAIALTWMGIRVLRLSDAQFAAGTAARA
jgi:hypothetical protein